VLQLLRADQLTLGFVVEQGKMVAVKIKRPVFFGENGAPTIFSLTTPAWQPGLLGPLGLADVALALGDLGG
jgi:hypothetical protein